MTSSAPDRRQVVFGLAASGLCLTSTRLAAAAPHGTGKTAGLRGSSSPIVKMHHGMRDCRFGAMHFRYVEPAEQTQATPVLCLHASPASGISFAEFLPLIGSDRLAIAPDNPGFGLSDRPAVHPTIGDFAGAIWDLVDSLEIGKVDLIGTNTGAATVVEMANQRPASVNRIVLHAPPLLTREEIARFERILAGSISPDYETAASSIPDRWLKFAPYREGLSDDAAWQLFWEMNRDPIHRGWGHDAAFAYDFAGNLRKLKHPILVLDQKDQHDQVTQRARGMAPGIKLTDFPWSGSPFTTRAPDAAPLIRAFLDGKPAT